ncbi:MAG: extracellular solute-binding protein [Ignavibacteriales bacterium]|nr:extracellular solute-binding protein [Ignavibacteriales bacterium]
MNRIIYLHIKELWLHTESRFKLVAVVVLLGWSVLVLAMVGCGRKPDDPRRIVIWHQMRPDEQVILHRQLAGYMAAHPGIKIEELFKETEMLRSAYVVGALAGQGPDLVYGPSDPVGVYEATKSIRPLEDLFSQEYLSAFDSTALLRYRGHLYQIADKIGNHLALVYNKKYIQKPPTTDKELINLSKAIQAKYGYVAGRPNVYGITWNYTEPFFFIPFYTGFGGWVFGEDGVTPTLDNKSMVDALNFIRQLRDDDKIVPNEADYEIADALFKDGKAAMLINGDWSWAGYAQKGIDIGVAPLPRISATGLWCAPMTSPKGYSMNVNVDKEKIPLLLDLLKYLLSEECELETAKALNTAPTRRSLYRHPEILSNEILQNSLIQITHGKPMPVVPQMRAVWDAMRPSYQAVMGGARTPEQAARDMQAQALRKIKEMNE